MRETITQADFDERLEAGDLNLTLVGMSNAGKSWSAKRLVSDLGFRRIDCDGLIQAELGDIMAMDGVPPSRAEPTKAMAQWMGQPPDDRFSEREATYLEIEQTKMEEVIEDLKAGTSHKNTVIDTTGSIVHTSPEIRDELAKHTTVVLFKVTANIWKAMFQKYLRKPKPVIWDGLYEPANDETQSETLERCYYNLLRYRAQRYSDMAHIIVPREVKLSFENQQQLLDHIREGLPA